jgi:hypothetical protein
MWSPIVFVVVAVVIMCIAAVLYWELIKLLAGLVGLAALIAGLVVGVQFNNRGDPLGGILAGTAVFLLIGTPVLLIDRIGNLETSVQELGGKTGSIKEYGELLKELWAGLVKAVRTVIAAIQRYLDSSRS